MDRWWRSSYDRHLLQNLSDAGVQLAIGDTGKLKVSGDQSAVDRWLPEIRTHKPELIALLQGTHQGTPPPLTSEQHADIQGVMPFDNVS
jgi:hypothetical protein